MGISILELVLRRLREAGFAADAAYPGQKFPRITEAVAAAHIEKVDRAGMTVTVEVNIIGPAAIGGTTCELEALRATEVLRGSGAVCVQNACTYDGVAQVYVVQILATFLGVTDAQTYVGGPGFYVYIDEMLQPDVLSFSEEETTGAAPEYTMGESLPGGVSLSGKRWSIRMEELVPVGAPETAEPAGEFTLKVITQKKKEQYTGCRWITVQREYSKEGLRRIRMGFARNREEV